MYFKNCESTEADLSITLQSEWTVILTGDNCSRRPRVHQQRHIPSGENS